MNRPPAHPIDSRGAALLIVLGVLVLTVTACTILAQSAATAKLRESLDTSSREADALLPAAEDPIQDWLESKSATVVLDVDADQPRVAVLHDEWMLDDQICELTITAWDQCGMAPWHLVKGASPLRLAVPTETLARLDQVNKPVSDAPQGLDLLIETDPTEVDPSPFPSAVGSAAVRYGDAPAPPRASENAKPGTVDLHMSPAPGGLVSTHNPTAKINVNTAPITLVEAAMRIAGRGGLEQVIAARQQGKPAPAMTATPRQSGAPPQGMARPAIVSSSDCWSFRIDIRVGSVRRSWWAIYQPVDRAHPRAPKPMDHHWSCVQRLAINN